MAASNRSATAEHQEFDLQSVKEFMIANGGRVKNHQLVNYFRRFLNDPRFKAVNREKFKDFVNELSTIKVEEGDKILVLKRRYRPESSEVACYRPESKDVSSYRPESKDVSSYRPESKDVSSYRPDSSTASSHRPFSNISTSSSAGDVRAQSEPPSKPPPAIPTRKDDVDGGGMSKGHSEGSLDRPCPPPVTSLDSGSVNSLALSTTSWASSESQTSVDCGQWTDRPAEEEDGNQSVFSVKERAKILNRIESTSGLTNGPAPSRRKELKSVRGSHDDDESHSSGASYVTLDPDEREWMLTCCHSEYQEMFKLLNKNPSLAKLKDFTNTALHWAAKNGKPEVIKLIASKSGVSINHKSGGYTALHMAAIHGHEDIIELLIQGYKADANLRDYSGKKAKQYLKNSASTRTQQLLLSRRLTSKVGCGRSLDDSFLRSTSLRQSNRARAISSMLQAASSHYIRQPVLSWAGGSTEDLCRGRDPTPPGSRGSSPATRKLASQSFSHHDQKLMPPPPHAPSRKKKGLSSSSQETLDTLTEFDTTCTISKSGSDPSLVANKQTFI